MDSANALDKNAARDAALHAAIAEMTNRDEISPTATLVCARIFHAAFIERRPLHQQILGCIRMTKWINDQIIFFAKKKMNRAIKLLHMFVCDIFIAEGFANGLNQSQLAGSLKSRDGMHLLTQLGKEATPMAIHRLTLALKMLQTINTFAQGKHAASITHLLPPISTTGIHEILGSMKEMRKYGIKTVTMTDGLTHTDEDCWVLRDPREHLRTLFRKGVPASYSSQLLSVELVHADAITAVASLAIQKKNLSTIPNFSFYGFGTDYEAKIALGLDEHGEFQGSVYHDLFPLRPIFERAGEQAVSRYEMLRMMHTLHLFDLVVPTTIAEQVSRVTREATLGGDGRPSNESFLRNLVIPRLRILEKRSELVSALEEEVERADEEMVRRSQRPIKRHEVVGHPRRLRDGHRASPHAIALAHECGVQLADNETFVEKHFRGEGGQTIINTVSMR